MSLRLAGRFARREMRGGLRGFRLFLACLALGVAAIASVGSVRSAIEGGLQREGAALLGGAAEIDFTYRFATQNERDWIETQASAVSEVVEFRSMVVAGDGAAADRALTQVKAVDDLYPLVGEMALEPAMPLEQALGLENGLSGAVMERALSDRLGQRLCPWAPHPAPDRGAERGRPAGGRDAVQFEIPDAAACRYRP